MKTCTIKSIFLTLILVLGSAAVLAQAHSVTGKVSDANGPVVGATVVIEGTSRGVSTDAQGQYAITASPDQTLIFSFMGYDEQKITVGDKKTINVTLQESSLLVDEIVVIGYGVQRKSDVTGSVASVSAEDLNTYPSANVGDMLRGRAAGVTVTSKSGAPGSSPSIEIRGIHSMTDGANEPLFVIDGTPATATEFGTLNSNDVASVEILKDAAAQAVYGARAANGVVLVTTKRGKEGKVVVTFDTYVTRQSLWRNFDFFSGDEWYNLRKEAMAYDNKYNTPEEYEKLTPKVVLNDAIMEEIYQNKNYVDWEDLMIKPAYGQKYDLSVSGGSDRFKIAAGAGYYNQDGMVVTGSGYKRATLRLNVDYKLADWISIGFNTSFSKSEQKETDGSFANFITATPMAKVYEEDGSYTQRINSSGDLNPLFREENSSNKTISDNYRLNTFIDIKPFRNFMYRLNASYYNLFSEKGQYKNKNYPGGGAKGSIKDIKDQNYLLENILNYSVPFRNQNHNLGLTAMQSYDKTVYREVGYGSVNVPMDQGWDLVPDGILTGAQRVNREILLLSFLARAQYSFKDRYLLSAAWRRDGCSKFGENNKWGDFPSVALGWRISEESFLKDVRQITSLKLRLSWGKVGNQSGFDPYRSIGLTERHEMEFGSRYAVGYLPGSELSNPNLKWETTSSMNIGLDFGLFQNRLTGSVEYYDSRTSDLLIKRLIPSGLGYASIFDNLGKTKTHGLDISLNGDIIRKADLNWSVGANFTLARNEIVKVNNDVDENGRPMDNVANKWFVGHPLRVNYDYVFDGIYQYDDFDVVNGKYVLKEDRQIVRAVAIYPGAVKVKDVVPDGKIDENDRVITNMDPKFNMSFFTNFNWKGIDLFADFYWVHGRKMYNPWLTESDRGGSLQGKNNGIKVNYWTPTNPSNEKPRPQFNAMTTYNSLTALQDASYFRLRTLTLGYTLPKEITQKIRIERVRFYVTATNLFTSTDFLSYSPELTPGTYPEARQWLFGLNVSF